MPEGTKLRPIVKDYFKTRKNTVSQTHTLPRTHQVNFQRRGQSGCGVEKPAVPRKISHASLHNIAHTLWERVLFTGGIGAMPPRMWASWQIVPSTALDLHVGPITCQIDIHRIGIANSLQKHLRCQCKIKQLTTVCPNKWWRGHAYPPPKWPFPLGDAGHCGPI